MKGYASYVRLVKMMKACAKARNEQLHADCQAYIDGKIKTQSEIARKYGVTRACISKRVSLMRGPIDRKTYDLFISKAKELKRKTYGLRQMIVAQTRKRTTEPLELWNTHYD